MATDRYFTAELFTFLRDLKQNNRREWFNGNKERYQEAIKEPAQRFISDAGPLLHKLSPHILADPRPVGGSLFRIYRDTRFGPDKSPYKTHTGIHFAHQAHKDAHAPGFYLHLEPENCFVGAGTWRPSPPALAQIREGIHSEPGRWKRVLSDARFRSTFELSGESLVRPPRGYDPEHPLIDDLKRKDFVALAPLSIPEVTSRDFLPSFIRHCRDAGPLVRFLCSALGQPY